MSGSSVSSGIMGDVGIAEGIAIEKMTEVNGFAAGKELLGQLRCLWKIDMPGSGFGFDCIPRPNPGQTHIEHYHSTAGFWITAGKGIGAHAPDIVTHDINML